MRLTPEKARERKSASGIIGSRECASTQMKARSATTPSARLAATPRPPGPALPPSIRPVTSPERPSVASAAPWAAAPKEEPRGRRGRGAPPGAGGEDPEPRREDRPPAQAVPEGAADEE